MNVPSDRFTAQNQYVEIDESQLKAFRQLIEERFGLLLAEHQISELRSSIAFLASEYGYSSPQALWAAMTSVAGADLLAQLAARMTIGETHFFRITPQIEALRSTVIPDILRRSSDARRINVWSAGCSTGEEAYTLAILIREALGVPNTWTINLIATDVNRNALDTARRADYGTWSFRDTPAYIRERYFTPEGKRWRVADDIRRMVRFECLNLVTDDPPVVGPRLFDLILCRNVTIYFSQATTQRLYRQFARVLAPDGWLVLGPSDPTPNQHVPLEPQALNGAIVWRHKRQAVAKPASLEPPGRKTPSPGPTHRVPVPAVNRTRQPVQSVAPRAIQPPAADATIAQIRALAGAGELTTAIAAARSLIAAQPTEVDAHLTLGLLHLDTGAIELALESARRAVFLDTNHALAHATLGRIYLWLGDTGRARPALVHARRLLAALPGDRDVPGAPGVTVDQLRQEINSQLAGANAHKQLAENAFVSLRNNHGR